MTPRLVYSFGYETSNDLIRVDSKSYFSSLDLAQVVARADRGEGFCLYADAATGI